MGRRHNIPEEHGDCIASLMSFIESESSSAECFAHLSDEEISDVFSSASKVYLRRHLSHNKDPKTIVSNYYSNNRHLFSHDALGTYLHDLHVSLGIPRKEDISKIVRAEYPESGSQSNEGEKLRKQLERIRAKLPKQLD